MSGVIRVGNIMLKKDKVVGLNLIRNKINVVTTIGESTYTYNNDEDAQKAFEVFYEQLNEQQ